MNSETRLYEPDARSKLVTAFFESLNKTNISYTVMNNYEDLPDIIPSDIDITVPAAFFACLDGFILDFTDQTGTLLVQKIWHGNRKCAYIIGTEVQGFLQLDFFNQFSTKFAPALLSHEELIADSWPCKGFYAPHPKVELLFIVMRRLFKDDWSERHCVRIAELQAKITDEVWLSESYEWLSKTIEHAVACDLQIVKSRRANDWKKLRQTARQRSGLRGLVANTFIQARRLLSRLRDETGMIIVTEGHVVALDNEASKHLETIFHRHVELDEKNLETKNLFSALKFPFTLTLLKRRKGLIFLGLHDEDIKAKRLTQRLTKMGQVDLTITEQNLPCNQLVHKIVSIQAEKTHRAIALGGTQTSARSS